MQQKQQDTLLLKLYYGDEKEVRVLEVRISSLSLSLSVSRVCLPHGHSIGTGQRDVRGSEDAAAE